MSASAYLILLSIMYFFGETLNAEHVEEEVYVPPQYDKVVPPLTVSATQNGVDKIDLTWSNVVSASGYRIYRSEESETGFELLSEVSETVFSDNGSIFPLKLGVSYYYKISDPLRQGYDRVKIRFCH